PSSQSLAPESSRRHRRLVCARYPRGWCEELIQPRWVAEFLDRLVLQLSDALPGDPKLLANLLKSERTDATQTEAPREDFLLALRYRTEEFMNLSLAETRS